MGRQDKRVSILDGLKAGEVIVADDKTDTGENGTLVGSEPGAGPAPIGSGADAAAAGHDDDAALEPADAFGPDPVIEPGAGSDTGTGQIDALGRDASKPRGKASPNYGKNSKAKADLGFIEKALSGAHSIFAVVARDDLWELTDDEAKELAKALGKVQDQYNINLDPKVEAWLEVAGVGMAIYGPRIATKMMLAARKPKPEPEPKKEEKSQAVFSKGTMTPTTPMNGKVNGDGPFGAFTPSMIYPPGMAGGSEE